MAYLRSTICSICGKEFRGANDVYICHECYQEDLRKRYNNYMSHIREGRTLKQRIEQIEDWIYQHRGMI
jgi:hypothetical protein